MNVLAIDTSTSFASIAVSVNEQIVAETLVNTNRTLSARLVPEIERLLATVNLLITDIDIFSSSIGPGSFTGVRGGIATIQGFGLALKKPCAGFSSLAMLAMNFSLSKMLVCPMLDARKSEVYTALYDCSVHIPSPMINDSVMPPAVIIEQLAAITGDQVIFAGDGAVLYRKQIVDQLGDQAVFAPFQLNIPHAANGVFLALHASLNDNLLDPSQLLPLYLRASDAELMKAKALKTRNEVVALKGI